MIKLKNNDILFNHSIFGYFIPLSSNINENIEHYRMVLKELSNRKELLVIKENVSHNIMKVLKKYDIDIFIVGREIIENENTLFKKIYRTNNTSVVILPY